MKHIKRAIIFFLIIIFSASILSIYLYFKKPEGEMIYYRDKVLVISYQHVAQKTNSATITPQLFAAHMQTIKDYGYNVISMEQFLKFMDKQGTVPPNALVITFEDGYESFYTQAYPILNNFGYVASNFIVVAPTEESNTEIPHLSWDQMRELKKIGMSFYSHTYDSHKITTDKNGAQTYVLTSPIFLEKTKNWETQEEYEARVREDLQKADNFLQDKLENQRKLLAFPYGAYNPTVLNIAQQLGIEYFFTEKEGINEPGMKEIKRINVGAPDISPLFFLWKLKTNDE